MRANICGRLARPASIPYNIGKTLCQIVVFWSFFLWFLPTIIYEVESTLGLGVYRFTSPFWRVTGVVLFLLMSSLGITSGMVMAIIGQGTPLPLDCTRQMVIVGPYRYVRNPMAIAGISQGIAVALYLGSPLVLIYALLGILGWNYFVRPWEEQDLEQRFGNSFRDYHRAVRCWIPRWHGYTPPGNAQTFTTGR